VVIGLLATGDSSGLRVAIRVVAVACCLLQLRLQRPMDRAFQLRGSDYGRLWGPGLAAVFGCGLLELVLLAAVAGML
jgi:hypothetical protein